MDPLKLVQHGPENFSIILSDSSTDSINPTVEELGHTPNGYFWEGVAMTAIRQSAPDIDKAIKFDCEAGMFCAYGKDRAALEKLGNLMSNLATDPSALRELMKSANPEDFDD